MKNASALEGWGWTVWSPCGHKAVFGEHFGPSQWKAHTNGEESRRCEYNLPPSLHTLISALLNVIIIKDGWGNKISQLEMKQGAAQRPKVSREQRALQLILST